MKLHFKLRISIFSFLILGVIALLSLWNILFSGIKVQNPADLLIGSFLSILILFLLFWGIDQFFRKSIIKPVETIVKSVADLIDNNDLNLRNRSTHNENEFQLIENIIRSQELKMVRLKEESHNSNEKFKGLFEHSDIAIWDEDYSEIKKNLDNFRREGIVDLREYLYSNEDILNSLISMIKVTHVNEATMELFGARTREEFLNYFGTVLGPNANEIFIGGLCAIWDKQPVYRAEPSFITIQGNLLHTVLSFKIPERDNDFRSIPISVIDITKPKQNEEEIKVLRNYLVNIIDSMPSVLIGVDPHGMVTQWNHEAQIVSGIDAQFALGKSLKQVFPRLSPELSKIFKAIKTGKKESYQGSHTSANGEVVFEDITIFPLNTKEAEGAVIRLDDVTEHKRLEELMIQSEKMLSVGGLAAGMAHEINNPLAGIIQTADVMSNRLGRKLNINTSIRAAEKAGTTISSIQKYMEERGIFDMLSKIKESGGRIAEIVSNMLNFARKSEGQFSSESLEILIKQTLKLAANDYSLKKEYDFKSISIIEHFGEDIPLVPCDRATILQVILNILQNGSYAMQNEKIENSQFILSTHYDAADKMVSIVIEDNGPGMTEEVCKRVFEPFFTTKPVGIGTGLGLSVSYFIITEIHKGSLSVQSAIDIGSKFIIKLPEEI